MPKDVEVIMPLPTQRRIGPILLAPGVSPKQVLVFLFVTSICVFVNEFASVMQPLIFALQLHIAPGQQGVLAGMLGATQQTGMLIFIIAAGALADIFGRKVMLLYVLIGFFLCLVAYPLIPAVWALFIVRFVWGLSFTGFSAGAATISMDIPDNCARGKLNGLVLVSNLLVASLLVLPAARLPALFRGLGLDAHAALAYTFGFVALIASVGLLTVIFFFHEQRKKPQSAAPELLLSKSKAIFTNVRAVLAHACQDKRFAVILMIGSVVRTDAVIVSAFLGLWIVNAGSLGGIDAIEATKMAGLVASIRFVAKVTGALLFGVIADKVNRMWLMLVALTMTTLAFGGFGLVSNAFGMGMIAMAVLIGLAESAEGVTVQSLIAQEAPEHLRGSSMGVFTFLGTISLLVVNLAGGYLFDRIGFSSPMLMEGALHLMVLITAIVILRMGTDGVAGAPPSANILVAKTGR
ncbi:MAG TPA: MFS transporter [Acidobacteriaceae bacterium]|jgi:MFS family permease|nr:MFS transporter [Acidobacteriaceae bacterium]